MAGGRVRKCPPTDGLHADASYRRFRMGLLPRFAGGIRLRIEQAGVAVGVESVAGRDGVAVGGEHGLAAGKGGDQFFCGGGASGKVRVVRRPERGLRSDKAVASPVDATEA